MPAIFPMLPYEAIHKRVVSSSRCSDDFKREQFNGSWRAIAQRFRSNWQHSEKFTRITKQFAFKPLDSEHQYAQERELFGFFVSSLAAFESFCYSLYVIGSFLDATIFRFVDSSKPNDLRNITPKTTLAAYAAFFQANNISTSGSIVDELKKVIDKPPQPQTPYQELEEVRNILIHRIIPTRINVVKFTENLYLGTSTTEQASLWVNGIPLDKQTTRSRQKWLAVTLKSCLEAAEAFTRNSF